LLKLNNMKLSISIMMHPSREEFKDYLKSKLGDVPLSMDNGIGIWANCKQAWRLHNPEAEWHVVIQDDAIVCDDFLRKAENEIMKAEELGCDYANFFFGKRKLMDVHQKFGMQHGYWMSGWLHWGIAICAKVKHIEPMLKFGDTMNIPQDDTRLANYVKSQRLKVYYPIPSLIEHRIGKSLVGDRGVERTAFLFIDNIKK